MHLHCPHCHNPIEVVTPDQTNDVHCPSCGSSFRVVGDANAYERTTDVEVHSGGVGSFGTADFPSTPLGTRGRFVLQATVGFGAFGTVYKAYDPQLDRV